MVGMASKYSECDLRTQRHIPGTTLEAQTLAPQVLDRAQFHLENSQYKNPISRPVGVLWGTISLLKIP